MRYLIEYGGRIISPTIIRSPAHPDTYYANLNCTWTVEARVNQVVDIKSQSFTLETHRDCRHDWVAVYDGVQLNDTQLLGRFCGNLFIYQLPRIKSRGQRAVFQFKTDYSDSQGGFSAIVWCDSLLDRIRAVICCRFCGSVPPQALIASGNSMWPRQAHPVDVPISSLSSPIKTPCGSAGLLDASDS